MGAAKRLDWTGAEYYCLEAGAAVSIPTKYVICADDRMMNNDFWRPAAP